MFYDRVFLHNIIDYSWLFYKAIIETACHDLPQSLIAVSCQFILLQERKAGYEIFGTNVKKMTQQ